MFATKVESVPLWVAIVFVVITVAGVIAVILHRDGDGDERKQQ